MNEALEADLFLFWAGVRETETQTPTETGNQDRIDKYRGKRNRNGKRLFNLIWEAAEEQRETEKQNRKKVTESKRVVSVFSTRTRPGQSCSARLAGRWSFRHSRPGESQVKLVPQPGILPPTNKPHNGTLSDSKWEHSFSLPQVYLSPHALTPQCRGVLR